MLKELSLVKVRCNINELMFHGAEYIVTTVYPEIVMNI